ncbi:hypothetical protein SAMN05446589_8816 [Streptomyces sp. OV198]|nr:hypothetical protein SAMN05446589_8816 [Streptomyces sp. OV198]
MRRLPNGACCADGRRFFEPGCRTPSVLGPEEVAGALDLDLEGREVVERLVATGRWQLGDPEVLVVLDAGHDALSRTPWGGLDMAARQKGAYGTADYCGAWRHASIATASATPARARSPAQPFWSPTRPT